jgi:hypothetical protein
MDGAPGAETLSMQLETMIERVSKYALKDHDRANWQAGIKQV